MKKKGKLSQFPGPRGPQMLPQPGIPGGPGGPGGPVVKQKISELDFYKWRLAHQKEQTLVAKQSEIQRYKELLAREEDNLRLRIHILRLENQADIGHLNLGQGDSVTTEENEHYVVRAPRPGPIPPVNKPVELSTPPAAPESEPIPPVPSAAPEAEEEEEEEGEEGDGEAPEKK